jgi:hypothetical protein
LDGLVNETGVVFEAEFVLPSSFSDEAAGKHTAQLQHDRVVQAPKTLWSQSTAAATE